MNKFRYVDKKILCNYDLREEFFDNLGLKINDMTPLRKVFVLFVGENKKILKITDSIKKRVEFIDKSLKYINKSFPYVLQYCKNKEGNLITEWDGKNYIVLNMVEGREVAFTNPLEVELCSKALANMHLATKGLTDILSKDEIIDNKGKNLINQFKEELIVINEIEKVVNKFKYKNHFDELFLDYVEEAKKDVEKSVEELNKTSYEKLYNDFDNIVLCHNDLAHHNFIIDNDDVNIIDFDYCNLNTRIVDIYNFTVKVIKNLAYDKDAIKAILSNYSSISEIKKEEIEVLYALINYPRDFMNISLDYYLKQKSWDEEVFINRLENKIELNEYRKELIANTNQYFD